MGENNQFVKLSKYKQKYKEALQEFKLPEDQVKFTALPAGIIEKADEDTSENLIVILADNVPVGFFVLNEGKRVLDYSTNMNAMLLSAFSINFIEQKKGYANKALLLLPGFVSRNYESINEILLAVNKKNLAAQQLYIKSGFEYRGQRRMGPIGEQFILHLTI